jgi:hypothetical protein
VSTDRELICSACLYVRPRPGADLGETDLLTVIDGQLLCVRHAGCHSTSHHGVIMAAVHMEANGEIKHLSDYQNWRSEQDTVVRD